MILNEFGTILSALQEFVVVVVVLGFFFLTPNNLFGTDLKEHLIVVKCVYFDTSNQLYS